MNLVEKLESWRWIKPIPSKPPKKENLKKSEYRNSSKHSSSFSKTFTSHLKEWQKEQKYNYSNPVKFSTFSHSIVKSARKLKSEIDRAAESIKSKSIFGNSKFRQKPRDSNEQNVTKSSLFHERESQNPYVRSDLLGVNDDEDEIVCEDVYLVPKTPKLVTFADSKSTFENSSTSSVTVTEDIWLWSDLNHRAWNHSEILTTFRPENCSRPKMNPEPQIEPDSDPEDDPGKLLNVWLGELDNLKKGLNSPPASPSKNTNSSNFSGTSLPPVIRRKTNNSLQVNDSSLKTQYRCSLINLDECTQDEELDAILGELSVLESQFDEEIADQKQHSKERDIKKDASPVESEGSDRSSGMHSRSSSGSVDVKKEAAAEQQRLKKDQQTIVPSKMGKRTDSPDNDSAFCDNLSVLSSCSASSLQGGNGTPGHNTESPPALTAEEQEARIKAEKIKLAIEKIREASIKKLFIKVFTADGSAKSLLVDEKMSVGYVTRILAEKNHVRLDPKWALVELIPDLYMERVYEDNENLVENCLMWKIDSKNTLWFIERPEKFDVFRRPELYLLGSSSSQRGDAMEDHSRQELIEEYFSSSGVGAPEVEGFVWLKADNKKSWKKFYFVLRSSGLYYAPKGKKTSKDLVCLATFDVNQVYYGAGWKKKYKSPTEFCFAIKHPQIQVKTPKYIRYLCVDTERELHQWVTGIRVAKGGKQLYENYRCIEEEITHADIDILTSKRFSGVNNVPPNTLAIMSPNQGVGTDLSGSKSPARTPSSENKSFDSALSSGIQSECCSSTTTTTSSNSNINNKPYNIIDAIPENEVTPVNTLDRSGSVCPSTSSSSGCLSDRCSSSSSFQIPNEHGFESDFPAGGTIKKRPSANPRIPLTNTTWGLVGGNELEDENNTANIRVGGGGTLLRHSLRRKSSRDLMDESAAVRLHRVYAQVHREPVGAPVPPPVVPNSLAVDPMSAEFETSLNGVQECETDDDEIPLPPPPRAESMDLGALVSPVTPTHSHHIGSDLDDLPPPPPPPEMSIPENPYHVSPVLHSPPALPPPTMMKSPMHRQGPTKKISFDDNVQLIGISSPVEEEEEEYEPWCPKNIVTEMPKKLSAPPENFLQDLQRVMTKKWQIAERCRGEETSPHQVLGFRDLDMKNLVGTGHQYSRDDSVGAWVLHSQKYAAGLQQKIPQQTQEPLYAVSSKNHHMQQTHNNGYAPSPPPHAVSYAPPMSRLPPLPPNSRPPVVLREPTPDYETYSSNGYHPTQQMQSQRTYIPSPSSSHSGSDMSNYSTLYFGSDNQYSNGYPSQSFSRGTSSTSSLQKRAPPPPRRSETTHLSTTQT